MSEHKRQPERVVVYDKALRVKYPVPAGSPVGEGLEVVEGEDGTDHKGDPVPIQYDVDKSGKSASTKKEAQS